MSDRTFMRGIYYFDVVAALLALTIVLGRLLMGDSPASPALARDVAGFWVPLLAVALLTACRRRAYTQETPWVAVAFAALALLGIAAVFWRSDSMVFMAVIGSSVLLLLAGLALRARRLLEPLSRPDLFAMIVLVGGVCIGVALTEVVLRLAAPFFSEEIKRMLQAADPSNLGVAHPYIGYLHTPNNAIVLTGQDYHAVHHVDALGFRNSWPWPDQTDIVALGDSVTFGQCVQDDEAWPYLVGQTMSPRSLVNLGLIGAGPPQYLRVFETFGVKLRPKLVLVGVFARNDFWDADVFDRWLKSGLGGNFMVWRGFGQPPPLRFSVREPRDTLERLFRSIVVPTLMRSYVYALVRGLRGDIEREAADLPRILTFPDGGRVQLFEADFLSKTSAARPGRRPFRLVLESLQQIYSLASEEGAHVLAVLLPGKEEVYLPLLGETTPDPTSALRPAMDKLGIEYLNLTPDFRARAEAGEQLFFEVDGHPNRAGYALIAQLVLAHITENAERYGLTD